MSKDVRSLDAATDSSLKKMAGNGMHIGCAAFAILVSMICVSDVNSVQPEHRRLG